MLIIKKFNSLRIKLRQIFSQPKRNWLKWGIILFLFLTLPLTVFITLTGRFDIRKKAAEISTQISEVNQKIRAQVLYSSTGLSNLEIKKIDEGIYTIKARKFPCTPGQAGCEPDKYEIRFPRVINNIYGLGMQAHIDQVEVSDFLDESFGFGHLDAPQSVYNSDIGRLRTPVFVLPTERMIVAYIQPYIKKLRLSRNKQFGCPTGNTCIVLKKHEGYNEGSPGTLLIIKGSSVSDMYSKYYRALKNLGFYFKPPHWNAFGLIWETYAEAGMKAPIIGGATVVSLKETVKKYEEAGLRLSALVFGSGYWKTSRESICTSSPSSWGGIYKSPTIDSLTIKDPALKQFFSEVTSKGIYPLIGMRQHASERPGNALSISGEGFLKSKFNEKGIASPFLPGKYYSVEGVKVSLLNVQDEKVVSSYVDLLRNAYGGFKGFKEDEMLLADTKKFNSSGINLPDGTVGKVYQNYVKKLGNDIIIMGRNDWFGVGTDLQNTQGYTFGSYFGTYSSKSLKFLLDSTLNQVASGYPHPKIEDVAGFDIPLEHGGGLNCADFCGQNLPWGDASLLNRYNLECKIPATYTKDYLRNIQLRTFSAATMYSRGFWHLKDPKDIEVAIYFAKLRMRLQQYAYDQASQWYQTGVPWLMQPLFIRYAGDNLVYSLYKKRAVSEPINEYMFGNALLIRPIYSNEDKVKIYFPAGKWKPFLKVGGTIQGPVTRDYQISVGPGSVDYPVFLKEGEILVISDPKDYNKLNAYVFLETTALSNVYSLYRKTGGTVKLQAVKLSSGEVIFKNLNNGKTVSSINDPYGKGFKVADISRIL